ncbi:MAG: serine hydrolase [Anaerolineaceae bacterium]|nr:serine hydrolase [Anaerolineaceae bacterium]
MSTKVRRKQMIFWIVGIVILLVATAVTTLFWQVNRVQRAMTDFIIDHPGETAVVTYTFDENGILVDDGSAVFHNADEPLVVASVMKTAVLAAYAEMVVNGELDPNEAVPVAEWERFYLPGSDGGAHIAGLRRVGLAADELGFAVDQTAVVTLDDLATMMMHYSGNAATDYLLERVGLERVTAVTQTHLRHHTPIHHTLGYALAVFNHEAPFSLAWVQSVQSRVASGDFSDLDRLIDLYTNDARWRQAQLDFMGSLASQTVSGEEMWAFQETAVQLMPKGTAHDYARMMAQVGSGRFISAEVSALMQQKMETVASDWPLRLLYFDRFAAKDGTTAGVLSLAAYSVPKRSALRGENRVVVLLTNGLPLELFTQQVQFQGHYLLPIDLAQARTHFTRLRH